MKYGFKVVYINEKMTGSVELKLHLTSAVIRLLVIGANGFYVSNADDTTFLG